MLESKIQYAHCDDNLKYVNENAIKGRYDDVHMVMVVWRLKLVW